MTFRETLEKHLSAIQEKNLPAFGETVAQDEIILITADGRLVMSPQELLGMHKDWFAMDGWNLEVTPVQVYETPEMGVAVLRLRQVTSWPMPMSPEVTPATARSPVPAVESMCRSMLRERSKTRSTGAAMAVVSSITGMIY